MYLSVEIGATPSAFQYNSPMNWEKQIDKTTHYVQINHLQIVFGSMQGSGHTDNAGTASHADFLAGRFQDDIRRIFGESVLRDVIASVRSVENDPIFAKKLRAEQTLLDALSAIPLDARLAGLLGVPPTEKGSLNYGNAGGYKTVLKSDSLTLTFERDAATLVPNIGGAPTNITLPGHGSSAVALHDHFYIVVNDNFVVVTPNGDVLKEDNAIFGETLRIKPVSRWDDVIVFAYRWFQNQHPRGWLVYELGEGFTGRWVNIS